MSTKETDDENVDQNEEEIHKKSKVSTKKR